MYCIYGQTLVPPSPMETRRHGRYRQGSCPEEARGDAHQYAPGMRRHVRHVPQDCRLWQAEGSRPQQERVPRPRLPARLPVGMQNEEGMAVPELMHAALRLPA